MWWHVSRTGTKRLVNQQQSSLGRVCVTCERSCIGSGVAGMLSCSGRGEGGAGGTWTVSGGLIAVGACGWWTVNDGVHGDRTAGAGVGRVRCSSFATGSGGKASRLSGAARVIAGVNFRRNLRLRNVMRPEPSTRIAYWSCCRTSTTFPVLSHLRGLLPVWFWMRT